MDWGHFFVSFAVATGLNLSVELLFRRRRRERSSPLIRSIEFGFAVFQLVVIMGALSGAVLWIEALLVGASSALVVGLTYLMLAWARQGMSVDDAAQWQVSAALAILRVNRRGWLSAAALSLASYALLVVASGWLFFTVGLAQRTQAEAVAVALTVCVWLFATLSLVSFLGTCRLALQSSTDEGTRTFLLAIWTTTLVPSFMIMLVMRVWNNTPAIVYEMWTAGGRTLELPLAALLTMLFVAQAWVYFAGVVSRRRHLRDLSVEEADLARLLKAYQDHASDEMYLSVETALDRSLQAAAARTFTPMEIVTALLQLESDSDDLDERGRLEEGTEPTRPAESPPNPSEDWQLSLGAFFDMYSPPTPYWRTTPLPKSRWVQCRWLFSWIDTLGDTPENRGQLRELADLISRSESVLDDFTMAWQSVRERRDEWFAPGRWNLIVDQLEELPHQPVEFVTSLLAESQAALDLRVSELPPLKRPARWILATFAGFVRLSFRMAAELLDRSGPALQSLVRVIRRMPEQDLDWRHYMNVADARAQLASIKEPQRPRSAVRKAIETLGSFDAKQKAEATPLLRNASALFLPGLGSIGGVVWAYLVS